MRFIAESLNPPPWPCIFFGLTHFLNGGLETPQRTKAYISVKTHISIFLATLMLVSSNIYSKGLYSSVPWIRF